MERPFPAIRSGRLKGIKSSKTQRNTGPPPHNGVTPNHVGMFVETQKTNRSGKYMTNAAPAGSRNEPVDVVA